MSFILRTTLVVLLILPTCVFAGDDPAPYKGRTLEQWVADLTDEKKGDEAWGAVFQYGAAALPWLDKGLASADADRRLVCADLLGALERVAEPSVAALRKVLDDKNESVRVAAILALGQIGGEAKAATKDLQEKLSSPFPYTVSAAALSYYALTGDTKTALPFVEKALDHDTYELSLLAAMTLGSMGSKAAASTKALNALAFEEKRSLELRCTALRTIGLIKELKIGLTALTKALGIKELREAAALAVGDFGSDASFLLRDLRKGMRGEDEGFKHCCALAIIRFETKNAEAMQLVVTIALQADNELSDVARQTLHGIADSDTRQHIQKVLTGLDPEKLQAMLILGSRGPRGAVGVPAIVTMLASEIEDLQLAALQALGRLGPLARGALPQIEILSSQGSATVRKACVIAIGKLAPGK